jgi:CTP:molybdopterin cytidylyltransferase MocA
MRSGYAAVILAAGLSSRQKGFKPFLPLGDRTVLERAVATFQDQGVTEIAVVTGHRGEETDEAAKRLGVRPVHNPDFASGMFSSVLAGMRAVPEKIRGIFMLPVDIPLVRATTIVEIRAAFERCRPEGVLPCFRGEPGHPPLLSGSLRPLILNWSGRGGLGGLLETRDLHRLEVADKHILMDMDTPEQYRDMQTALERYDILSPAEADLLMRQVFNAPEPVRNHCRAVAGLAVVMGKMLAKKGVSLDLELIEAGGMLHDLAKGHRDHEREGGRLLRQLGFAPVADIVEAHRDFIPPGSGPITEKELVFLADKLIRGEERVTLEQRFSGVLFKFAHDPDAVRAITRRLERAGRSRDRVRAVLGKNPEEIFRP